MASGNRKILAASFVLADGGSRGAGAVAGAFPDQIGNTAVLHVKSDGTVKFVESKDWGAGRGALLGGAIGIIGGPIGMIAGGGIGALAAKLRDSGFPDSQLEQLGRTLQPGGSAVVVEIGAGAVATARELLSVLGANTVVVEDLDTDVAGLFDEEATPQPEPDPAATPAQPGS
ncbi:MAG: DUF1269 domain-containing protein [Gaiellales bacterium]